MSPICCTFTIYTYSDFTANVLYKKGSKRGIRMRYLKPVDSEKEKLRSVNTSEVTSADISNINEHIDAVSTLVQNLEDKVDQHIQDQTAGILTNKLITPDGTIEKLKSEQIESETIETTNLTSSTIFTDRLQAANRIDSPIVNTSTLIGTDIQSSTITTDEATVDSADIRRAEIGDLTVSSLHVDNYDFGNIESETATISTLATDNITTKDLNSETANIDTLTVEKATMNEGIITHSRLQHICNEEIWHSYYNEEYQNTWESTIYEMPLFKQGNYVFTLRDKDTLQEIFSLYITNSESNLTYAYSKGMQFLTSDKDPLSEAKVRDVYTNPRLYVKSSYTGIGYWHYEGLDHIEEASPATYVSWPFDISLSSTMSYRAFHRAATVFTMHLDYGDNTNTGVAGGSLVMYFKDKIEDLENTESTYEYNPDSGDTVVDFYVPDQTVNSDSNVKFNKVSVNELAITSITENFMFLRSRADGTFEVVLALNPDSIRGIQPIDNPITGNSVYYWNGIALAGGVTATDVITVDTSLNLCSNTGNNQYKLQQWTLKDGDVTIASKAFKHKSSNDYLFFDIFSIDEYYERQYAHMEISSGTYAGLYYDFFLDDYSLMASNQNDYDMEEWSIPTTYDHAFLHDAYYYAECERVPITDDEGTNEYHLIHLGDGTTTHGDHTIEGDLKVVGSTYVSGPITSESTITGKDAHFTSLEVKDDSGEATIVSGIIKAQREIQAPKISTSILIGSDIETSNLIASNIWADSIHTNKFEASMLTADKISTPWLVASQIDNKTITTSQLDASNATTSQLTASDIVTSTLTAHGLSVFKSNVEIEGSSLIASTTDSFFNSVDAAIVKANEMRAKMSHLNIDNEDDEDEVGIIANLASTLIHLDIQHHDEQYDEDGSTLIQGAYNDIRFGASGLQVPLAERDEKENMLSTPAYWNGTKIKTLGNPWENNPSKLTVAVTAKRDSLDAEDWKIDWGEAGSGGGNGTVIVVEDEEELNERLRITDMMDENYIPNHALVIIKKDKQRYLTAEDWNASGLIED